jgi:hypothetical protein
MITIRIIREEHDKVTFGVMFFNGRFQCFTLEPTDKMIPPGRYDCELYVSPKIGKAVILLNNVPGRSEIEIHPGNFYEDSLGCILVGDAQSEQMLMNSQAAFKLLMSKISLTDKIQVVVEDDYATND